MNTKFLRDEQLSRERSRAFEVIRWVTIVENMLFNGYSSLSTKEFIKNSISSNSCSSETADIVFDIFGMRDTDNSDYFSTAKVREFVEAYRAVFQEFSMSCDKEALKRIRSTLSELEKAGRISSLTYKIQLRLREIQFIDYFVSNELNKPNNLNKSLAQIAQEVINSLQREHLLQTNTVRLLRRIYGIDNRTKGSNKRQGNSGKLPWVVSLVKFEDTQDVMTGAPTEQDIKKDVLEFRNREKLLSLRRYYNKHSDTLRKIMRDDNGNSPIELRVVYDFMRNAFLCTEHNELIRIYGASGQYSQQFVQYAGANKRTKLDRIVYLYQGKKLTSFELYKTVAKLLSKYVAYLDNIDNLDVNKIMAQRTKASKPNVQVKYGASIVSEDVVASGMVKSSEYNKKLVAAYYKLLEASGVNEYRKPLRWPDLKKVKEAGYSKKVSEVFEALADGVSEYANLEDAIAFPFPSELYLEIKKVQAYDPCFGDRIYYTRKRVFNEPGLRTMDEAGELNPEVAGLILNGDATKSLGLVVRVDNSDSCRPDSYITLSKFYSMQAERFRQD